MKKRLFALVLSLVLLAGQAAGALAAEDTALPDVTETPVETAAPETAPEVTDPPVETAAPETEAPADTEAPVETAVPSEEPETTEEPVETEVPETEAPAETEEPFVEPTFEPVEEPAETPEPTPEVTACPYAAEVTVSGEKKTADTLEEAWALAQTADKATVTLMKDAHLGAPLVMAAGDVTLAGGYTISAEDKNAIQVIGGKLTLAGVSVSVTISEALLKDHTYEEYDPNALAAVVVSGEGELKLTDGQIQAAGDGIRALGGKLTVTGGAVSGQHTALYAAGALEADITGGAFAGTDAAIAAGDGRTVDSLLGAGGYFVREGERVEDAAVASLTGAVSVKKEEVKKTFTELWAEAKAQGGTVTMTEDTAVTEPLVVAGGENVTLDGGEFILSGETEGALLQVQAGGVLTIAGGAVNASGTAVAVEDGGVLEVTGGEITGGTYGILAAGSVTVSGGAVTGETYAVSVVNDTEGVDDQAIGVALPAAVDLGTHGAVSLSGGTFTSGYAALYAIDPMAVTLSGGVYIGGEAAVAVPGDLNVGQLLAEGYEYKQDGAVVEDVSADYLPGTVSVRTIAAGLGASVTVSGTTTEYDTIEEAWAAATAADSATVTLLGDVTVTAPLTLETGHAVTFAGGDYSVTGTGASVISVTGGSLTVASGEIVGADFGIRASAGGAVTISGGTVIANRYGVTGTNSTVTVTDGTVTSGYTGMYLTGGTASISGGTVSGTAEQSAWGVTVTEGGTLTVSGGAIYGTGDGSGIYADGGEVTLSAGTVSGGANGIRAINGSKVAMTGGAVSGETYGVALADDAEAEISGGEISSNCGVRVNSAKANITGGRLTTDTYGVYVSDGEAVIDGEETVIESGYNGACLFGGTLEVKNGSIKGVGEDRGWGIYVSSGLCTVTGGTIEGKRYGIQASDPTTAALGGGTFTGEFAVKTADDQSVGVMLQSGCVYMQDETQIEDVSGDSLAGTVSVLRVAEPKAARVIIGGESVEYDTFAEAWAAAKGGLSTIQLLSNVEAEEPVTVEEGDDITLRALCPAGTGRERDLRHRRPADHRQRRGPGR